MNIRNNILLALPGLVLLALLALICLVFVASTPASAACSPPGTGDWVVSAGETCSQSGASLTVNGNLIVQNTGSLTLTGTSVTMSGSSWGERTIEVQNGGTLKVLTSSSIQSSNTFSYNFIIHETATAEIKDSTVRDVGYDMNIESRMGLLIESDAVTIQRSYFSSGHAGLLIKGASPKIDNSTFSGNLYGMMIVGKDAKPTIYDSTFTTNGWGAAIDVRYAGPIIGNCQISDNYNTGVFLFESDATLFGSDITNNGALGIYIQGGTPKILNNSISDHGENVPIFIPGDGLIAFFGNPIIKDNKLLNNNHYTMYLYGTGGIVENNIMNSTPDTGGTIGLYLVKGTTTIKNNYLSDSTYQAMGILSGSNADIIGNNIEHHAFGVRVASSTVRFVGNIMHNYTELYAYGLSISGSDGYIRNNTFIHERYGIDASYVNDTLIIEGNVFEECKKRALNLYEGNVVIRNNRFTSNIVGINITSSKPKIYSNTFNDNPEAIVVNRITDAYIADNLFMFGNYSISLDHGKATVVNNTFKQSYNYSLLVSKESFIHMSGNFIDGNAQKGVYIQFSQAWLSNNTFTRSGTGLYIDRSTVYMDHNTMSKNMLGLYVMDTVLFSDNDHVANNTIQGVGSRNATVVLTNMSVFDNKMGLSVQLSRFVMEDSLLLDNEIGLFVEDDKSFYVHNITIIGSSESSVQVWVNTPTLYFDELTVLNSSGRFQAQWAKLVISNSFFWGGEAGIQLTNASLTVRNTLFEDMNASSITTVGGSLVIDNSTFLNNRLGVFGLGTDVSIIYSTIEGSNETGVMVEGSNLLMRDSRVLRNTDGIMAMKKSTVYLLNCNISSNTIYGVYTDDSDPSVRINVTRKLVNKDNDFLIHGQFIIDSGGQLYLIRSNLQFWSDPAGESGLVVRDGGALFMRENVLSSRLPEKGYYFRAEKGSMLTLNNVSIRHIGVGMSGFSSGLEVRTDNVDLNDIYFESNQVGLYVVGAYIQAHGLRFVQNEYGMKVEDGEAYLEGSSFNTSGQKDFVLTRSTGKMLDCKFTYNKVEVQDQNSLLIVMWYLDVTVLWNDGQPVIGAKVTVKDTATGSLTSTTNNQGETPRLIVKEYQQKGPDPSGYLSLTPHTITVKVNDMTVEKSQYVGISTKVTVTMNDDKPPVITITTPETGSILYTGTVLFIGTADDEGSAVELVELSLDGKNWFEANGTAFWSGFMTLPHGTHTVQVRATDSRGNSIIISTTVEVDLISPLLQITYPPDGSITNASTITVHGKVHQGGSLLINDVQVHVAANGTFSYLMNLEEGQNVLHAVAYAKNGLEHMETNLIVIKDTKAPEITLVHPSPNSLVNTSLLTVTVSANEEVTFLLNGHPMSAFGGKADGTVELEEGPNTVYVTARDLAGNTKTYQFNVTLDITKPNLVLIKPSTTVFSTSNDRVKFKGSTEPGANLTLNGKPVIVAPDGTFTVSKRLGVGKNPFELISRDKAGNANIISLEATRKKQTDITPYVISLALLITLGVAADVATVMYFKKYYKPKGAATASGTGPSPAAAEETEEKELIDGLEGEEGWDGKKQAAPEAERKLPKRPPPSARKEASSDPGQTEFEEVEDLGEF